MNNENSRISRKKLYKRRQPSIKKAVTKFVLFVSVIIIILSLTHEKWMASITKGNELEKVESSMIDLSNNEPAHQDKNDEQQENLVNGDDSDVNSEDNGNNEDDDEETTSENNGNNEDNEEVSSEESNTVNEEEQENHNNDVKIIIHTVQENETLYKISMKYYGNRKGEQLIKEQNNLKDNNIYIGQKLEVPIEN
jgi:LysM repeat protein